MRLDGAAWAIIAAAVLAGLVAGGIALSGLGAALAPGLGLKGAAAISFGLTVAILVVFLIAAGDGLIGEIQFVLPAFFVFFAFNWVLIAWIF